ncbi:Putative Zn2/Cys6 DNA-binding protein [Aspergillus calidoustus]|uniref:Putative Zn2/Cys6 DNA-binding protein n=1 Tax=Aspergillus calidoustus TaxID=454130 RepID=A0A0U4ZG03_ASPCI|nr:Putative Zn2/Cys6 DNA-binding protein [Aspergillus calidoustus]
MRLDTLQPRNSRKSHRKSRLGCLNCKRRHIKCDELKPQCANCTNHSSVCDYSFPARKGGSASTGNSPLLHQNKKLQFVESEYQAHLLPSSSTPPSSGINGKQAQLERNPPPFKAQFTLLDLKLQHQFLSSTCLTLAENQGSLQFWQTLVPRMGYSFSWVLHLSLALAGLHMRRSPHSDISTPSDPNLNDQIEHHYIMGLQGLSQALANLTPHTSHAVWIGSILLCFISMARGPRTGNYLFFSTINYEPSEWISLLKGVQVLSCLDELRPHIFGKESRVHQSESVRTKESESERKACKPQSHSHDPLKSPPVASCCRAIQSCIDLLLNDFACDPLQEKYLANLSFLHQAFMDLNICTSIPTSSASSTSESVLKLMSPTPSPKPDLKLTFIIWTWTSLLGDGLDAVQCREPMPLLLLAVFLVLFKQLDSPWFARGWAKHILTGIEGVLDGVLDEKGREVLRWPKEVILGKAVY